MESVSPIAFDEGWVPSVVALVLLGVTIQIGRKYGRWLTMWALLIGLQLTLRTAAVLMSKAARFVGAVLIGGAVLWSIAFYVLLPLQQSPDKLLAALITSSAALVAILLSDPAPERKVRSYAAFLLLRQNVGYLFAVVTYYVSSVALASEVASRLLDRVSRNEMEDLTGLLLIQGAFFLIVLVPPLLAHHLRRGISKSRIWTSLERWSRQEELDHST